MRVPPAVSAAASLPQRLVRRVASIRPPASDHITVYIHYTLAIKFLPDRTIEVSADEASGLIRNGKLVGTPRYSLPYSILRVRPRRRDFL
jgi:hypothetical protein